MANQATAYWTQGAYPRQGQSAYGTQSSAQQPTWEEYYNWAKQLYANGDKMQGDVYYRHAQLLYEQTQAGRRPMRTAAYPTYSNTSPALPRITADISARYSVAVPTSPFGLGVFGAPIGSSSKHRTKVWVLSGLLIGLAAGVVGLSYLYRAPLTKQADKVTSSVGFAATWIQDRTLQPTLKVMQPAAEKILRLSLAAQPLLYELKLGETPPKEFYAAMWMRSEGADGKNIATASAVDRGAEPSADKADASMGNSMQNAVTPVASAEVVQPTATAPSNEQTATAPISENEGASASERADSAKTVASNAEGNGDKADDDEDAASSSQDKSERSHRHRSHRSHHAEESTSDSNNAQRVEWSEPGSGSPTQNASASQNAPSPSKAPAFENAAPIDSNSKTKELDALLAPKSKAPKPSETSSEDNPASSVPKTLSRIEVQQGMARVAPAVKNCGQGTGGTLSINLTIGADGRIVNAVAAGAFTGTPIGDCAEREVRRATFPTSEQSITVKYPFAL